jgi:ABC-type multidrug transport system, ATPase component
MSLVFEKVDSTPSTDAVAPVLEAIDLTVGYARSAVATDLSLCVRRGEVIRISGQNASGKSTFVKTLTGIIPPIRGRVEIGGYRLDTQPASAKRLIGYSSGDVPYTTLTGREHLTVTKHLWKLDAAALRHEFDGIREWPLYRHLDEPVASYSRGTVQQLALLQALIHKPTVFLLDEAFDSIDADTLGTIFRRLRQEAARGAAVVYVSHRHPELRV